MVHREGCPRFGVLSTPRSDILAVMENPRGVGRPLRRITEMPAVPFAYSFSIVHWRGWPCWREKSITCVTLVSATS